MGAPSKQKRFWDSWGCMRPARVKREEEPADATKAREHRPFLMPLSSMARNVSPGARGLRRREGRQSCCPSSRKSWGALRGSEEQEHEVLEFAGPEGGHVLGKPVLWRTETWGRVAQSVSTPYPTPGRKSGKPASFCCLSDCHLQESSIQMVC